MRALVIIGLIYSSSFAQIVKAGEALSLEINIKPEMFTVGEPFYLEYSFKNEGTNAVYIHSGKGDYSFYVKDYVSSKVIMPSVGFDGLVLAGKDCCALINPSERYTYTDTEPLIIHQRTNENYLLEYDHAWCHVNKSGFIIKGRFIGCDIPMDELYELDEFKDLDRSVPLIEESLEDEVGYVFDGGFFHKRQVDSNREEGLYTPLCINHREVECARFDGQEDLVIYETGMVRIEVEKSIFMGSLEELVELNDIMYGKSDRLLLDHLKRSKGSIDLVSISDLRHRRVKGLLSDLLCEVKCQVYDLSEQEYIKSFLVAEWADSWSAGLIFMFKDDSKVFFEVAKRFEVAS